MRQNKKRWRGAMYGFQHPTLFLLFLSGAAARISWMAVQNLTSMEARDIAAPLKNKRVFLGPRFYRHGAPDGAWALVARRESTLYKAQR